MKVINSGVTAAKGFEAAGLRAGIKAGKTNKIKVRLSWENDENNNQMDTTLGTLKGYTVNIPINVTATQYLGETIEEYMPEETT